MTKLKPAIRLAAPLMSARKTVAQPTPRSRHAKRLEAEKQALLALEQSLRLQSYTIRLPRTHPLFSSKDSRRCVFPSVPVRITRIQNGK
jgi:hypothetical protein